MPQWLTIVLTAIVTALASSLLGYLFGRAQAKHQRELKREDVDADRRREAHVGILGVCDRLMSLTGQIPWVTRDNVDEVSKEIGELFAQISEFGIEADEDIHDQAMVVFRKTYESAVVYTFGSQKSFEDSLLFPAASLHNLEQLVRARVRQS